MDFPLELQSDHLLLRLPGGCWILDTGSPRSFGDRRTLTLAEKSFDVSSNLMGLNAEALSDLSGISVRGLIGTDILNEFDILFDVQAGQVTFSDLPLNTEGKSFPIEFVMGVPTTNLQIQGREVAMVFDTGATFSYWQGPELDSFSEKEIRKDYFPGVGEFEVKTFHVPVTLGNLEFHLVCGRLPEMLGLTLSLIGVEGILGNEFFREIKLGYLPRRKQIVLL
jgi:hypothetical protein